MSAACDPAQWMRGSLCLNHAVNRSQNAIPGALRTLADGLRQLAEALDTPAEAAPVADVVHGLLEQVGVRE